MGLVLGAGVLGLGGLGGAVVKTHTLSNKATLGVSGDTLRVMFKDQDPDEHDSGAGYIHDGVVDELIHALLHFKQHGDLETYQGFPQGWEPDDVVVQAPAKPTGFTLRASPYGNIRLNCRSDSTHYVFVSRADAELLGPVIDRFRLTGQVTELG